LPVLCHHRGDGLYDSGSSGMPVDGEEYPWGLTDEHFSLCKELVQAGSLQPVKPNITHPKTEDIRKRRMLRQLSNLEIVTETDDVYTPGVGAQQMCGMKGVPKPLWPHFRRHDLVKDIDNGIPFTFSRWGDTEIAVLFGRNGKNSDGHAFMPGWRSHLEAIFEAGPQPNYRMGQGSLACCVGGNIYLDYLRKTGMLSAPWYDVDELPYQQISATGEGKVFPMLETLYQRKHFKSLCIVGHSMLEGLSAPEHCALKIDAFISTFPKNCASQTAEKIVEVAAAMQQLPRPIMFMASCSFMANILVHSLYPEYGQDCWLLDVGSIWEPYPGVWGMRRYKRGYFKRIVTSLIVPKREPPDALELPAVPDTVTDAVMDVKRVSLADFN
jgi:hypothetical protein